MIDVAHDGKPSDQKKERGLYWIKWVYDKKPSNELRYNCVQLGGTLFHQSDGAQEQLGLLDPHSEGLFFTGFSKHGFSYNWLNPEGQVISSSLFHWYPSQTPDESEYTKLAFQTRLACEMGFIENAVRELPSMCDIKV